MGFQQITHDDLVHDIQENRYYVVLLAYDYPAMLKGAKHKLWEARISVSEGGNQFDKALPGMIRIAGPLLGADSKGLQHDSVPIGRVDVGETQSLGEVPSPKP
jgi:hypothetical protein